MEANILAIFFQRRRRNHRRRRMGENVNKCREGLLQGNFDRGRIDRLGAGDIFIQVIALEMVIRVTRAVEVSLDRLGVKVGAILEFHPAVQLDGVHQAVR